MDPKSSSLHFEFHFFTFLWLSDTPATLAARPARCSTGRQSMWLRTICDEWFPWGATVELEPCWLPETPCCDFVALALRDVLARSFKSEKVLNVFRIGNSHRLNCLATKTNKNILTNVHFILKSKGINDSLDSMDCTPLQNRASTIQKMGFRNMK